VPVLSRALHVSSFKCGVWRRCQGRGMCGLPAGRLPFGRVAPLRISRSQLVVTGESRSSELSHKSDLALQQYDSGRRKEAA